MNYSSNNSTVQSSIKMESHFPLKLRNDAIDLRLSVFMGRTRVFQLMKKTKDKKILPFVCLSLSKYDLGQITHNKPGNSRKLY